MCRYCVYMHYNEIFSALYLHFKQLGYILYSDTYIYKYTFMLINIYLNSTLVNVLPKYLCFQTKKTFGNALQGNDMGGCWDTHPLFPIHNFKDHHYSQTSCDRKIGRKGQESIRNQVQI